jgi:hypothetical protein
VVQLVYGLNTAKFELLMNEWKNDSTIIVISCAFLELQTEKSKHSKIFCHEDQPVGTPVSPRGNSDTGKAQTNIAAYSEIQTRGPDARAGDDTSCNTRTDQLVPIIHSHLTTSHFVGARDSVVA